MECQFCATRLRGSGFGCRKCKPKIVYVEIESYPSIPATQIAVEITANGQTFRGYLPAAEIKAEAKMGDV